MLAIFPYRLNVGMLFCFEGKCEQAPLLDLMFDILLSIQCFLLIISAAYLVKFNALIKQALF